MMMLKNRLYNTVLWERLEHLTFGFILLHCLDVKKTATTLLSFAVNFLNIILAKLGEKEKTKCTIISSPEISELIGYSWSVIRPLFTMPKDLLLQNRFANQSQILCGASLGRRNKSLFAASGSHDQDGRHAHIW